ncbi:MAG: hypothetical protein IT520_15010 [Burkholderiales bacterium]|nr:hypothetical protein [Burkholderiales bacterium]
MNASLVRLLLEIAGAIAGSALGAGALAIAVRSLDAGVALIAALALA